MNIFLFYCYCLKQNTHQLQGQQGQSDNIIIMSLQQLQEATKRNLKGLFFIKSKHVHPTFKNHEYFEMRQKSKTQASQQQQLKIQKEKDRSILTSNKDPMGAVGSNKWKMFVQNPSSFGIENTYQYMCNRIRISRKSKMAETQKGKFQPNQLDLSSNQHKRKMYTAKAGTERQMTTIESSPLKRRERHSEPANKYLQTTQSFNYRIRKPTPQANFQDPKQNMPQLSISQQAEHQISLTYIPSRLAGVSSSNLPNLHMNILPYITSCFLKCKINYSKLTNAQYEEIISYIEEIKSSTRQYFDIKDIINLDTVAQVLQILSIYGQGTTQWVETVRYFFMPVQDVLNYQFDRLVDELRLLSVMKFNAEIIGQNVYIYRVEDKMKISNIYDLLKPGTYIYSESKSCFQTYLVILRKKAQALSYKNRIKKWRSVAPLGQAPRSPCLSDRQLEIPRQKLSIERYEKLFEITKQRRKKFNQIKAHTNGNGILITANSNGSSYFVDRSKLHKTDDIFQ